MFRYGHYATEEFTKCMEQSNENTKAGVHTAGVCSHSLYTSKQHYVVVCVLFVNLQDYKSYPLGGARSLYPCRQVTLMIAHYQIWDVNLLQWSSMKKLYKCEQTLLLLLHHGHGCCPALLLMSLQIMTYCPQCSWCIL